VSFAGLFFVCSQVTRRHRVRIPRNPQQAIRSIRTRGQPKTLNPAKNETFVTLFNLGTQSAKVAQTRNVPRHSFAQENRVE
jgi:hypothetical protein